ncbi:MAG: hypothetical protein LUG27_05410 [Clostridiales bacterium]|nr:hypothetical protein [Clostridiales bacterium]
MADTKQTDIEVNPEKTKRFYRTKTALTGDICSPPTSGMLALPTFREYQNCLDLREDANAHLRKMKSRTDAIFRIKKGGEVFLVCQDKRVVELNEEELQKMHTKKDIDKIDLVFLSQIYTIILTDLEKHDFEYTEKIYKVYVPQLIEYLGCSNHSSIKERDLLISKFESYNSVFGIIRDEQSQRESIYPILNFEGYNGQLNILSFRSPYISFVIDQMQEKAKRRDKQGEPKLKPNGDFDRMPMHSYLVNSDIGTEKNRAAVNNVFIIAKVIEQAGNNTPHISAMTLLQRNVPLFERYNNIKSVPDKNKLLKRTFKKTWELLRTKTQLLDVYRNIQLPDPDEPYNLPTTSKLDKVIFEFPHDGKTNKKTSST